MTPVETRERANRAQVELRAHGDELEKLRADLIAEWAATNPLETDEREHIWRAVKTLDVVREALMRAVTSGGVLDRTQAIKDIMRGARTLEHG